MPPTLKLPYKFPYELQNKITISYLFMLGTLFNFNKRIIQWETEGKHELNILEFSKK
jgi:hypothetical protein